MFGQVACTPHKRIPLNMQAFMYLPS